MEFYIITVLTIGLVISAIMLGYDIGYKNGIKEGERKGWFRGKEDVENVMQSYLRNEREHNLKMLGCIHHYKKNSERSTGKE